MNDRILRAARRQPVDRTPIWLMRQAGRYMSVYRAIRERYGFLQMVKIPEVAAEVMRMVTAARPPTAGDDGVTPQAQSA